MTQSVAYSPWWLSAGCTMVHVLWIGACVGLFAWAGRLVLTHYGVAARYRFTLACLGVLALVPATLFPCLELQIGSPYGGIVSQALIAAEAGADGSAGSVAEDEAWLAEAIASGHVVRTGRASGTPPLVQPSRLAPALASLSHWGPWFWLAGSCFMLLWTVGGLRSVRRMCRDARPENGDIKARSDHLSASMGLPPIPVATVERLGSPILVGWRRPRILLPTCAGERWTSEQIDMVLIHELAHARRRDNLVTFLQRAMEVLFFFNPAVWYLSRRMQQDRETICDRFVLERTGRNLAYAELLLAFCKAPIGSRMVAAMGEHNLVSRIRFVLTPDAALRVSRRGVALAGLIVGLCLLSMGVYRTIVAIPLPSATRHIALPQPAPVPVEDGSAGFGGSVVPSASQKSTQERSTGATFLVLDHLGWPVAEAMCDANVRLRDDVPVWEDATSRASDLTGMVHSPVGPGKTLTKFYFYQAERRLAGTAVLRPGTVVGMPVPVVLSPACRVKLDLHVLADDVPVEWTKAFIRLKGQGCAENLLRQTKAAVPWHYEFDLPPGSYEVIAFGGGNVDKKPLTGIHVHCFDVMSSQQSLDLGTIELAKKPAGAARQTPEGWGLGMAAARRK